MPPTAIPDDFAERAALWRTVSRGRRLLILLDHAHTPEQLRLLLPAGTGEP
ncbi:hypothetical protein [Micromonospora sp. NPDC051296]|uniref:hypothetical protein n=1 Tax=Micromonospora sp. NPDC051296 TaxID=3155046 RepID=UPI00342F5FDF